MFAKPTRLKMWMLILLVCVGKMAAWAQNGVAINTSGSAADASSILDLTNSINKGLLLPQVTSTSLITSPAKGLVVYQTNSPAGVYCNTGTSASPSWLLLSASSGNVTSVGLSMPSGFTVSNSPVTSSGTLNVTTSLNGLLYGTGSGIAAATITSPLIYSNGALSIAQANGTTNGYLSSANWNIFNGKQAALSGTGYVKQSGTTTSYIPAIPNADLLNSTITINGTGISLGGTKTLVLASPDFANQGSLTTVLHGNAAGNPSWSQVNLAADVIGILPVTKGGTGLSALGTPNQLLRVNAAGTSFEYFTPTYEAGSLSGTGTATQLAFWNTSNSLSGSNNLYWDTANSRLGIGTNTPSGTLDLNGDFVQQQVVHKETPHAVSPQNGWDATLQTATITTHGPNSSVLIISGWNFNISQAGSGDIGLFRDNVLLNTAAQSISGTNGGDVTITFSWIDKPPPGSHTYELKNYYTPGTLAYSNSWLQLVEIKE